MLRPRGKSAGVTMSRPSSNTKSSTTLSGVGFFEREKVSSGVSLVPAETCTFWCPTGLFRSIFMATPSYANTM
jgi:hypothetical protein